MTVPRTEVGPYLAHAHTGDGKFVRLWHIDVHESSKKDPAVVMIARSVFPADRENPSPPSPEMVALAFKELHKQMDKGNTP